MSRAKLFVVDVKNRWKKVPFYGLYAADLLRSRGFAAGNFCPDRYAQGLREKYGKAYIDERVAYCNKTGAAFAVQNQAPVSDIKLRGHSLYTVDMMRALKGFDRGVKLDYRFGDVTVVPSVPTIVKSRPIAGDNQNAVLLKLNSARHFYFVRDPLSFAQKKNLAVWRGNDGNPSRKLLVAQYGEHPMCDVAAIRRKGVARYARKSYLQISSQLACKFIISIEGNDVATNTKWIMSSNSLCMMPRPKFETWFMEGKLKPTIHYVPLADDFSDLAEKITYYSRHTDEAMAIIKNANDYVMQFQDAKLEAYLAHRVLKKYLHHSGQLA